MTQVQPGSFDKGVMVEIAEPISSEDAHRIAAQALWDAIRQQETK